MRVTIPDHLADHYAAIADGQGRTLEQVLVAQLDRFQHCPPGERTIAVNVLAVEHALGGVPVKDGQDLIRRISDLASISFHSIKLDFTAAQLEELQRRADREGKSVQKLAEGIVEQLQRQFFWGEEAASAVR